ncbi:hypothetical protein [Pseudarthrobacter enclensis]|uniref:Uncharacterized protein n=1 Tax=Pseudarthrobacter enclensis TaxID=993070 RepID=A0ABT9RZ92_9MICC|nr:hypothetical protein [Pseudarthrobacter enclensis]MDP9890565.1 hypothetical protein [Pseudarthrobacter enclensis]
MTPYLDLTKAKAEAAFQEYLEERGPALGRLRGALEADGEETRTPSCMAPRIHG